MLRRQRGPEALAHRSAVLRRAPAAALSSETSCRERDSTAALRCDAAPPSPLPPESASTTASPAGNSRAEVGPHPPPQLLALHPRQYPPCPIPSCSSPSASI